jgi:hypothetical protein
MIDWTDWAKFVKLINGLVRGKMSCPLSVTSIAKII